MLQPLQHLGYDVLLLAAVLLPQFVLLGHHFIEVTHCLRLVLLESAHGKRRRGYQINVTRLGGVPRPNYRIGVRVVLLAGDAYCILVLLAVWLRPLKTVGHPKTSVCSGAKILVLKVRFWNERHVGSCV